MHHSTGSWHGYTPPQRESIYLCPGRFGSNSNSYVDGIDSVDDLERYNPPPFMCMIEETEKAPGKNSDVKIAFISISPATGDVVWDDFQGNALYLPAF